MVILGIESSCDETAAAICKNGKIISSIVKTQNIHSQFGGVVPEIASREHDSQIHNIVRRALKDGNCTFKNINSIATTYGAGLLGSLLVGLNYAKGSAIGLNIPFMGVNHLEGHLYSSLISCKALQYPYICLLVTGGHTQIWEVRKAGDYALHATTVDDAAGEAFDKGARILGLGYPGGPEIEKAAENGDPFSYPFTIPNIKRNPLNFSFSGLKTALFYKIREISEKEREKNLANIAASYQEVIIDSLLDRLIKVIHQTNILNVSITGGVAANKRFREKAGILSSNYNVKIDFPPLEYCTDNAAMIAIAGYQWLKAGYSSSLNLDAKPNLALDGDITA